MAKSKFRPLHDRVVVKRIDAEEKTKGGIIIPDTAKEKPQEGKVVAVGPGRVAEDGKRIAPEVKKGGIIIPDTAKEKPQEGKIVATGKGKTTDEGKVLPMDVKPGDRVLYGKYSGSEIKIDDQEYLIMHQEDILGILS